jgi:peptidylprolyl isomerase
MNVADAGKLSTEYVRRRRVQWGDTVRVDFMAWLEDGTLFDSSIYCAPPVFTVGTHSVIQGVENLVVGMTVGESRTERIPPDQAFGAYRPELSCQVSRSWLQAQHVEPSIGLGLEVRQKDGTLVRLMITELDGERVTLDANHRLAGKHIMVQLDLLEIMDHPDTGTHCD